MSIIGNFNFGSASAVEYSTIEELMSRLPDNTEHIIVAQDVRDSIYSLWSKVNRNSDNIFKPLSVTISGLGLTLLSEVTNSIISSYLSSLNLNIDEREILLLSVVDSVNNRQVWTLQNIMKGNTSFITNVDVFLLVPEQGYIVPITQLSTTPVMKRVSFNDLGVTQMEDVTNSIIHTYLVNLSYVKKLNEVLMIEVLSNDDFYNFSVKGDWIANGVVDESSFVSRLLIGGLIDVVISDFNLVSDHIFCNIVSYDSDNLELSDLGIYEVIKIDLFELKRISLSSNNISDISSLYSLSNLKTLMLGYNNFIEIPDINYFPQLILMSISNNPLDDNSFTLYESIATTLSNMPLCQMVFVNSTDSISGTNLYTILASKGITIYA